MATESGSFRILAGVAVAGGDQAFRHLPDRDMSWGLSWPCPGLLMRYRRGMAHKTNSYVILALLGSLMAWFDSGFEFRYLLLARSIVIVLCCYLLHGQFVTRRWYFGAGIVVDEMKGENMELMVMKIPLAFVYVFAIVGCSAAGLLFGFENAY